MRQPVHPPLTGPPSTCPICAHGCRCPLDGDGCGHYGCWGRGPRTCPGVDAEEARYVAALTEKRAADARLYNRRAKLAALYQATVLATLTTRSRA